MSALRPSWQTMAAALLVLAALATLPIVGGGGALPAARALLLPALIFGLLVVAMASDLLNPPVMRTALSLLVFVHIAAASLLSLLGGETGNAGPAFFLLIAASWLLAWRTVTILSGLPATPLLRLLVPVLFGVWILILWEAIVRGAGIPFILLPPPSAVWARMASSLPTLWADVNQTIFKAVLVGYAIGCLSGFAAAVLADRFLFLRRGLLPIGNMVSALPIIGIAPITVMWFGFDWPSKAAVVVVMTFFPMLVNTVAGLSAAGHMERDLMRTYAAGYWQTLAKLRLPAAMPFIFNALKINSTLALIGAIVAEFFGTPVVGMGFRISTEVGRMNIDMVWAEIAVAALAGSVFYGGIALIERAVTFWHPSVRGG